MARRNLFPALAASAALAASVVPVTSAAADSNPGRDRPHHGREDLTDVVRAAMVEAGFDTVVDFGAADEACPDPANAACAVPAPTIAHMPNVDVAVIALDGRGRVEEVANVVLSRDLPDAFEVKVDRSTLSARNVRFRAWDIDRWNGVTDWNAQPLTTALNTPDRKRSADFMAPYPASLFKILVAYHVMTLVDSGAVSLDAPFTDSAGTTLLVSEWMDEMITVSSNSATRAMMFLLHQLDEVDAMNANFARLGLGTLQINGTDPATGGNWVPGRIHMTSLDTAKLFLLIDGGKGTLWRAPGNVKVTRSELSEPSRDFLKRLLAEQGFHEVLSTGNFCGAPYATPGIPALVPQRWIDPSDGTVTVDGIPYFQDVRPCNHAAEVEFAHKTGLTWNYGSDGGIVTSLPGAADRHYIIVFMANLGYRYTDPVNASSTVNPCFDPGVCYSQRIPAVGAQIDAYLAARRHD
jgi:hypothetical protein